MSVIADGDGARRPLRALRPSRAGRSGTMHVAVDRMLGLAGVVLLGVVSLTSFALHTQIAQPVLAESEVDLLPAVEPEAMGEALFVAKGCIQCHVYDRVTMAENMIQIGPNLTYVKRPPEYLQAWLTNPPALKPETQMPNLQLSEAEIDELVAFLQQD